MNAGEAAGTGSEDARAVALARGSLPRHDEGLRVLSEAGLFESMPHGKAGFVQVPEIRASVQRALVSDEADGASIIMKLIATAAAMDDPPDGDGRR